MSHDDGERHQPFSGASEQAETGHSDKRRFSIPPAPSSLHDSALSRLRLGVPSSMATKAPPPEPQQAMTLPQADRFREILDQNRRKKQPQDDRATPEGTERHTNERDTPNQPFSIPSNEGIARPPSPSWSIRPDRVPPAPSPFDDLIAGLSDAVATEQQDRQQAPLSAAPDVSSSPDRLKRPDNQEALLSFRPAQSFTTNKTAPTFPDRGEDVNRPLKKPTDHDTHALSGAHDPSDTPPPPLSLSSGTYQTVPSDKEEVGFPPLLSESAQSHETQAHSNADSNDFSKPYDYGELTTPYHDEKKRAPAESLSFSYGARQGEDSYRAYDDADDPYATEPDSRGELSHTPYPPAPIAPDLTEELAGALKPDQSSDIRLSAYIGDEDESIWTSPASYQSALKDSSPAPNAGSRRQEAPATHKPVTRSGFRKSLFLGYLFVAGLLCVGLLLFLVPSLSTLLFPSDPPVIDANLDEEQVIIEPKGEEPVVPKSEREIFTTDDKALNEPVQVVESGEKPIPAEIVVPEVIARSDRPQDFLPDTDGQTSPQAETTENSAINQDVDRLLSEILGDKVTGSDISDQTIGLVKPIVIGALPGTASSVPEVKSGTDLPPQVNPAPTPETTPVTEQTPATRPAETQNRVTQETGTASTDPLSEPALPPLVPLSRPIPRPTGLSTPQTDRVEQPQQASLPATPEVQVNDPNAPASITIPFLNEVEKPSQAVATQQERAQTSQQLFGASTPAGNYEVQISSQPTGQAAETSLRTLRARFDSVIGALPAFIRSDPLDNGALAYRVLLGPFESQAEAERTCNNIKGAGGSCFTRKLR